jgi:long-subunit acyl-CoA synthetase (AMP-forming)
MAISGIASLHAAAQQAVQSLAQHRRGGYSLTDVDAASSSAPPAPSKTGTIGSKIDISA